MKKILLFCVYVLLAATYVSAQTTGDYNSVASGDWTAPATWVRYNGTAFVAATDYPGQSSGTGLVTISTGDAVTLNVSPANAIGSLRLIVGTGNETLTISDGFTLNVTGGVAIAGAVTGPGSTKSIILNGAGAILNCATLALTPGNQDSKTAVLQFNG